LAIHNGRIVAEILLYATVMRVSGACVGPRAALLAGAAAGAQLHTTSNALVINGTTSVRSISSRPSPKRLVRRSYRRDVSHVAQLSGRDAGVSGTLLCTTSNQGEPTHVRLGISLPTRRPDGAAPAIAQLMDRARLIERLGFDGIWLGDSVGRVGWPVPDPLIWLTAAAGATEHIELGTAILQVPLRHPVELAQRLMTLHALSGGRFTAGLGSGSTLADFQAVGVSYEERFHMLAEALPTIRRLCSGERVGSAYLAPWSDTTGGPPILVGSWQSGLWVRRAAQEYDGWIASGFFRNFRELHEAIERYRDAGGKRALVGTITVDLHAPSTAFDESARFNLECGPQEAAERLQRLADIGYDDALLTRANYSDADLPEADLQQIRALLPPSHGAAQ
jgi:alkanesulfonate monooxygenase SsuD/methylene tetrahydromethanopterin reductase-like flavin-dependent oxidoreductase (luciferase family)